LQCVCKTDEVMSDVKNTHTHTSHKSTDFSMTKREKKRPMWWIREILSMK